MVLESRRAISLFPFLDSLVSDGGLKFVTYSSAVFFADYSFTVYRGFGFVTYSFAVSLSLSLPLPCSLLLRFAGLRRFYFHVVYLLRFYLAYSMSRLFRLRLSRCSVFEAPWYTLQTCRGRVGAGIQRTLDNLGPAVKSSAGE